MVEFDSSVKLALLLDKRADRRRDMVTFWKSAEKSVLYKKHQPCKTENEETNVFIETFVFEFHLLRAFGLKNICVLQHTR